MRNLQNPYTPRLWPNGQLPVPPVVVGRPEPLAKGWFRVSTLESPSGGSQWDIREPTTEAHLREVLDADLAAPDELLNLVEVVGVPVNWVSPQRGFLDPAWDPDFARERYALLVRETAWRFGLPEPTNVFSRNEESYHIAEVALVARRIRVLTQHVTAWLGGSPPEQAWQDSGFFDSTDPYFELQFGIDDEPAESAAWQMFSEMLNDALSAVHPMIDGPGLEALPNMRSVQPAITALAVMVFNDVAEGSPVSYCAYEKCGRPFRKQRGDGAGQFAKREGVLYCTAQHARTQSQLVRRRNARAESARGSNG